MRELTSSQLYRYSQIDLKTRSTGDVDSDSIAFMQRFHPRAYQSLNFGLHLKRNQNHIYIMGQSGVGRIGMTKALLNRAVKKKDKPLDVVLVSDFAEANRMQYLYFDAGLAIQFKTLVEEFVAQLTTQLPIIFDGHAYQLRSQQLETKLGLKQEKALRPAFELAESLSIEIQQTDNNFILYAIVEGKRLKTAELVLLGETIQKPFIDALEKVEIALNEGLTHFPLLQHAFLEEGKSLNSEVANAYLNPKIADIKQKLSHSLSCYDYLGALQETIVNKLHLFWDENEEPQTSIEEPLSEQQGLAIFEVNLLVDHTDLEFSPVLYEQQVTMPKLFGYTMNSAAANATDTVTLAMNHQAGLLQKANGGYLILSVQSILKEPDLWSNLKTALASKRLTFEIPSSSNVMPYHLPDFPLDVTVVLVGQPSHFYALQDIDSQFDRLFKVQVEFETELDRSPEHELALAKKLVDETHDWDDLPIKASAFERLLEYSSRLAEHSERLYTNKAILRDVLAEANAYARANEHACVTRDIIDEAMLQREFHTGLVEDWHHRAIQDKQILISTAGSRIGQVNGLTVVTFGKQSFGQPVRITAQATAGDDGVIDIETEADMSGPIHSKGVLILSGYVRGRYMRKKSLGFSASIVMEQAYEGIEGDSASSGELLALLSSLSQLPLRQDIAVTGAINQFGDIEPIGGANEKIEGFFKICQSDGLTGKQGVIIPQANACHLMLNKPVREAVEQGQFHIYVMNHIDEALTMLTGTPAGDENALGYFPEGSVNFRVVKTLEEMNPKEDKS